MMVCIAMVGDLMGVFGGLVVATGCMRIEPQLYISHTFSAIQVRDFITGLVKAGVFRGGDQPAGVLPGVAGDGRGAGVGIATSKTVVMIIVALIAVDLLFTGTFYAFGW